MKAKWLCLVWLAALAGQRVEAGESQLVREAVTIPERGTVTGYALWLDETKFSFIPPPNWSVKYDPAKRTATFLSPGLEAGITLKFAFEKAESSPERNPDTLREQLRARYPDARITGQFKCFAAGKEGLAFDFERKLDKQVRAAFRLAFIAFTDGAIECEMKTSSANRAGYHQAFGNLLNSFRIEQRRRDG